MNKLFGNKCVNCIVLFTLLSLPFLVKVANYDIWYHLVIGRKIADIAAIPTSEFYIYTLLGQKTAFHEWGFGLFYFLIYKFLGFYGMNIFNAAIGGSTLFILFNSCKTKIRPIILFIFVCITASFMYARMVYRPENILFLAMAIELVLLEKYYENKNWKILIPIPFITLALNFFHPSAIFVLAVFAVYIIQYLYEEDHFFKNNKIKPILSIFIIAIVTSCLNPYGIQQLLLPFNFVLETEILRTTMEFTPTLQTPYKYPFIIFSIVFLGSILIKKNRKIVYFLLFLMFFILAYKFNRNLALFSIVMFVPGVKGYNEMISWFSSKYTKIINILLNIILIVLIVTSIYLVNIRDIWGLGVDLNPLPSRSVALLQSANFNGNIFNLYRYGGYLGWELYDKHLVAIDGRHYTDNNSQVVYDNLLYMTGNWKTYISDKSLKIVVIPTLLFNSEVFPIIHYLSKSNEWSVVEQDVFAFTFVRSSLLNNKAIRTINKDILWTDVIRKSAGFTDDKIKNINFGIAYYKLRKYDKALAHMKIYQSYVPDNESINLVIDKLEKGERPSR